jgi:hypothetical protein
MRSQIREDPRIPLSVIPVSPQGKTGTYTRRACRMDQGVWVRDKACGLLWGWRPRAYFRTKAHSLLPSGSRT